MDDYIFYTAIVALWTLAGAFSRFFWDLLYYRFKYHADVNNNLPSDVSLPSKTLHQSFMMAAEEFDWGLCLLGPIVFLIGLGMFLTD